MQRIGTRYTKTEIGYVSENTGTEFADAKGVY